MQKLIDIHCHLSDYIESIELINTNFSSEILYVSTALNKSEIKFHEEYSIKYWFAGIHPWDAHLSSSELTTFFKIIPYDKILGLGEIGLDKTRSELEKQLKILESQLGLATDLYLPTLYHLVGYEYDFIKLHKNIKLKNMKIIHGFNSSYEVFKELDKLGFYFSLSKRILNNPKREEVIRAILASKRFFLESDAPNRADLDEVKRVAECLETDYNMNRDDLKEIQAKNFNDLLKEACESISKK